MKFTYGKMDWKDMERAQENCFLLTNGLGGYCSLTAAGSCTRNDHALLMAAVKTPSQRFHMLSKIEEKVVTEGREYRLSAQEYVDFTKNETGFQYLNTYMKDIFPVWDYQVRGIEIRKSLVMPFGENTVGIRYEVKNHGGEAGKLICTPWLQFAPKGEKPENKKCFKIDTDRISSGEMTLFYRSNGKLFLYDTGWVEDIYYSYDARDGRPATGRAAVNHDHIFEIPRYSEKKFYLIYSMEQPGDSLKENPPVIDEMFEAEEKRQTCLVNQAGIKDVVGQQLVKSGDCFLVNRESTGEKTIMAGYPFFSDWGRDTMIAVSGICIASKRYREAKSIFRSFLKYCKRGVMPNMFPESGEMPLYNTADASLLFINAVYEYFKASGDLAFVQEAWEIMCEIIYWYEKGTDFHISMDDDGLLRAGDELEQVTWMDVRCGNILPTPRHGKPVEINVWWYNSLKSMEEFAGLLHKEGGSFGELAAQVKVSFREKFWNGQQHCLRDVVSGKAYDDQVRCNQIWAVAAYHQLLTDAQEKQVVEKVYEELYTPYGLRTLSPEDEEFHPVYKGSQFERDMAYHQGTVWPFPLGAYYRAYLKVNDYSDRARSCIRNQLKSLEACMREGCTGQIPEVYDGLTPGRSKGCFAQAWSVGELLRVYAELENK